MAARQKNAKFTALLHHVTVDRLCEAFLSLKRNAAAGVDRVTWAHYARDLEGKADGRHRSLGIAALEDKIVQRTVVEVMSAIDDAASFIHLMEGL
jgi:hypothetical protein